MIKTIIIDDEQHCIDTLSIQLQEYCPDIKLTGTFRSGKAGLDAIETLKPDLIFTDIEMPQMNGFQMLEKVKNINFSVIFTTSFDQYAIRAIKFSALDYLLKPVDPKELIASVHKVKLQVNRPPAAQFDLLFKRFQHNPNSFNKIAIPTSHGFELIAVAEIIYCEADDNYTLLFLKDKRKITATRTFKEVEEQLNEFSHFERVHHSFMVNMNEINRYVRGEGGYLVMSDGSVVNVSRSRKDGLLKRF
ncbi:LytTR family DNA-binding domain-containing protein [Mucilaginibacter sabulilitoris]|uniref:LytTR family DNA-binding domain-containing protein n=1 Tax=Mucilaginibacter sabulilitoris TaxID=1173583 RepID=A0ABZ0TM31_9SPHI|nr:LytTR family DNA-binding domain-containing protein [Mucilaginibacter sabulilitoris]WPU92230.1 LytTR family DNA-binding domain-containing protein [Mucilaginibacter sabulilitoris]